MLGFTRLSPTRRLGDASSTARWRSRSRRASRAGGRRRARRRRGRQGRGRPAARDGVEVGTVFELHGQMRLLDVFDPDGNRLQLVAAAQPELALGQPPGPSVLLRMLRSSRTSTWPSVSTRADGRTCSCERIPSHGSRLDLMRTVRARRSTAVSTSERPSPAAGVERDDHWLDFRLPSALEQPDEPHDRAAPLGDPQPRLLRIALKPGPRDRRRRSKGRRRARGASA